MATHCCDRESEKLASGFRLVSDQSLHSPHFSGNQYALVCSREEKGWWRKSPPVNICQMNSEQILSVRGYWWCIFAFVVMLKISFIPTVEFPYSTGGSLLIMSSPMSSQRTFFGCCPVAGKPSKHWIAIWPAKFSLHLLKRINLQFTIRKSALFWRLTFENIWINGKLQRISHTCMTAIIILHSMPKGQTIAIIPGRGQEIMPVQLRRCTAFACHFKYRWKFPSLGIFTVSRHFSEFPHHFWPTWSHEADWLPIRWHHVLFRDWQGRIIVLFGK
jgi:hypothetical protein